MRRFLHLTGHGLGVCGATLGIESMLAAALPGLVRVLPLGMQVLNLKIGGVLGGVMVLIGALLVAASNA